jgi:excisionase family DNA binding protein
MTTTKTNNQNYERLREDERTQKIERKATELYLEATGKLPPDEAFCCTLKTQPKKPWSEKSYWAIARKIIDGKIQEEDEIFTKPSKSEKRQLLSPKEASRMTGFSTRTLWKWAKEGKIKARRFPTGKRVRLRYYRNDIEKLLGQTTDKTESSQ